MRVCILTTAHPTDDVRVNEKIGQSFLACGFEVHWVGPDLQAHSSGKVRDGRYRLSLFRRKKGKLGRFLSFREAYSGAAKLGPFDLYYCPDPDSAATALRLRNKLGGRVLFDIHEVFHGNAMLHWGRWGILLGNPVVSGLIQRRIRQTCKNCDMVMGVSRSVLNEYVRPDAESFVVRNCPSASLFNLPFGMPQQRPVFTMMHGKGLSLSGTDVALRAVGLACRKAQAIRLIVFASPSQGNGARQELMRTAAEAGAEKALDVRSPVDPKQMPRILSECELGLIMYDRKLGKASLPNRLFEYMAAGLPVLAPSYAPEIVSVIHSEKCGVLVDCEDPVKVSEEILRLQSRTDECRDMGARGRAAFLARYNWDVDFQPVLERIAKLAV